MNYVSVKMLCDHAKKTKKTVHVALKNAAVPFERCKGVRGFRIPLASANAFLRKQWPECGPLKLPWMEKQTESPK